jgi:hypothetical protein
MRAQAEGRQPQFQERSSMDSIDMAAQIRRVTLERTGSVEQADLAAAFVSALARPCFNLNVPQDFTDPRPPRRRARKTGA